MSDHDYCGDVKRLLASDYAECRRRWRERAEKAEALNAEMLAMLKDCREAMDAYADSHCVCRPDERCYIHKLLADVDYVIREAEGESGT